LNFYLYLVGSPALIIVNDSEKHVLDTGTYQLKLLERNMWSAMFPCTFYFV